MTQLAATPPEPLSGFHPVVAAWFRGRFSAPSAPQARGWPAIQSGSDTLIAAPTGSGKTLAAFLTCINNLLQQGLDGRLRDETQVVYVSPLKALSNDIQKNLTQPLAEIRSRFESQGFNTPELRVMVRTGDTPASQRQSMIRKPPHILVTTPESLYILLTSVKGREMLRPVKTVIVDEIHAVAGSKRGSHLALSLERLEAAAYQRPVRIGLSATQKPIEEIAGLLVGTGGRVSGAAPCTVVDEGYRRRIDLDIELTGTPLSAVCSLEAWDEIYDRLAALVAQERTTLIFVNTRRLAERMSFNLAKRLGEANVTSHHGSLSKEQRLRAEQRLKAGDLKALVATASLELGIDIGSVDLVCQVSSSNAISTLLQRVGRSGHTLGGLPRGRLFPLTRDDLVECVALLQQVRAGNLDRICIPEKPADILAQQIVATVAADEWGEDELFGLVRRAHPYRN
ncbi:MAG: DEAD/DEAH box helicase, partial [Chloroflexota bacterium]